MRHTTRTARSRSPSTPRGSISARSLSLQASAREIKGGKTDATIDLAMHGASPRQWAASANGNVAATIGPATATNTKGKGSGLEELGAAVNPFRNLQPSTELKCAVVRLPIRNGVAHVDRSIALETRELGIAASGTLDLRNETLDLAVKPQAKRGIPIDLVQLADLVRVSGTFRSPSVHLDSAATVATVAKIGAAVGTAGWSAGALALLKPSGGDANTCDVAAGRAPRDTAPSSAQQAAKGNASANPKDELAKALGKLFKH